MTFKILFHCESDGKTVETTAHSGEKLTQAAHRVGVVIQQTCGGTPSCTDCRVKIRSGLDDGVTPPEGPELRLMGNVSFITKERLACQTIICGNLEIDVPRPPARKEKVFRPRSTTNTDTDKEKDYGHQKTQKEPSRNASSHREGNPRGHSPQSRRKKNSR